jgi:phage antirepressor YoqD-like protein
MAFIESPTLRAQYATRTDALDKVKILMTLPDGMHVTTEMVATYYEVPIETIKTVVDRNREELEGNGYRSLSGADLQELKGSLNMNLPSEIKYASQLAVYSKRAVLNVGQLLTQSTVAQQVRAALLDGQREVSRKELAQWVVEAEERIERLELDKAQEVLQREAAEQERDQAQTGLMTAARVVTVRTREVRALEAAREGDRPKVELADDFLSAEGLYRVGKAAQMIGARFADGRAIGQNHLFEILRAEKILKSGRDWNDPYAQYADYFIPKAQTYTKYDVHTGEPYEEPTSTTYVTPKGVEFIRRRLIRLGHDVPTKE